MASVPPDNLDLRFGVFGERSGFFTATGLGSAGFTGKGRWRWPVVRLAWRSRLNGFEGLFGVHDHEEGGRSVFDVIRRPLGQFDDDGGQSGLVCPAIKR